MKTADRPECGSPSMKYVSEPDCCRQFLTYFLYTWWIMWLWFGGKMLHSTWLLAFFISLLNVKNQRLNFVIGITEKLLELPTNCWSTSLFFTNKYFFIYLVLLFINTKNNNFTPIQESQWMDLLTALNLKIWKDVEL